MERLGHEHRTHGRIGKPAQTSIACTLFALFVDAGAIGRQHATRANAITITSKPPAAIGSFGLVRIRPCTIQANVVRTGVVVVGKVGVVFLRHDTALTVANIFAAIARYLIRRRCTYGR